LKRVAAYAAVVFFAAALNASAQNQNLQAPDNAAGAPPGMEAQPGSPPSSMPGINHQPSDDATLEISPQTQPGFRPPSGTTELTPTNPEFRPGENNASINPEYRPGESELNPNPNGGGGGGNNAGNATSCLGMRLKYTNYCFKGAEEHGLEVTSIDRNSPAERAGLKQTGTKGGMLAAAETASALMGPLQLLTNHFIEQAAEGDRGDLIVAVDDQRVRSQADFNDAMARARPGDTMYLTVVRPLPGGDHKTLKIAVTVGKWQPGSADSCTDMTTASSQSSLPQ
jgi:PDZ domain-containing protein